MKRNSRAGRLWIRSGSPDKRKLELNIENGYYYQLAAVSCPHLTPAGQGIRAPDRKEN
jgi:hypothetical protein